MFTGCNRLMGGTDGYVPSTTSAVTVCKLGAGGVLTDPNALITARGSMPMLAPGDSSHE